MFTGLLDVCCGRGIGKRPVPQHIVFIRLPQMSAQDKNRSAGTRAPCVPAGRHSPA
jgi:hypothetical protein